MQQGDTSDTLTVVLMLVGIGVGLVVLTWWILRERGHTTRLLERFASQHGLSFRTPQLGVREVTGSYLGRPIRLMLIERHREGLFARWEVSLSHAPEGVSVFGNPSFRRNPEISRLQNESQRLASPTPTGDPSFDGLCTLYLGPGDVARQLQALAACRANLTELTQDDGCIVHQTILREHPTKIRVAMSDLGRSLQQLNSHAQAVDAAFGAR